MMVMAIWFMMVMAEFVWKMNGITTRNRLAMIQGKVLPKVIRPVL